MVKSLYFMKQLTTKNLINSAKEFCRSVSGVPRKELYGVTDGKAVGTFVEHLFQDFLANRYNMEVGSSANGLDLPSINTDIKVTSIRQPQSSCPFKDSKQKIYGLGYNIILFVYEKYDDPSSMTGTLKFVCCAFIDASKTADYQTTTGIRNIIDNNGNADDIFAFLIDHNIPADEITLMNMAKSIIKNPPEIGYLTISNALQWRLQYGRIVAMKKDTNGISHIIER